MDQPDLAKRRNSRRLVVIAITSIIALGLYGGFQDQIPPGWPKALAAAAVFAYLGLALALIVRRNKQ